MWPQDYQQRLAGWANLRTNCQALDLQSGLIKINNWWHQPSWSPYYLHWDDQPSWPDPWQLLADDIYCGVARALGIVYTIILLEHEKIHEVSLAETDSDNLVLINDGKYILNWHPEDVVNISSISFNIKRIADITTLKQKVR